MVRAHSGRAELGRPMALMVLDASPQGASVRGFASGIRPRSSLGLFSVEPKPKESVVHPSFPRGLCTIALTIYRGTFPAPLLLHRHTLPPGANIEQRGLEGKSLFGSKVILHDSFPLLAKVGRFKGDAQPVIGRGLDVEVADAGVICREPGEGIHMRRCRPVSGCPKGAPLHTANGKPMLDLLAF